MSTDTVTKLLRDITNILFVQHPLRLAVCLCLGVVLKGGVEILQVSHSELVWLAGAAMQPYYFYIALAILVGFSNAFIKRSEPPEAPLLRLIDILITEGHISQSEKRQIFRALIQKCIDKFAPNERRPEAKGILSPKDIEDLKPE
jgi:hypothetical protein